jgi:hypothetical protein
MAHFLRDKIVSNLTITEDSINQIDATFFNRIAAINSTVSEDDTSGKKAFLTYIIRFDGKGFRVFTLDELLFYFHQATEVERIIFTIETGESLRSSRQFGTFMELRLDAKDPNLCMLTVTSDNSDWVESSFSAVQDTLAKYKNKNGYMRTPWTPLVVQVLGVVVMFFLSLWAAVKISPRVAIENGFVFSFLFALLIFSNIWTYLNPIILSSITGIFPNIEFFRPRKDHLHWLIKAIVGGSSLGIVLYILSWLFSFVGEFLKGFVR